MVMGYGGSSIGRRFRAIERATRGRSYHRRKRIPENGKPAGPKLVRGRGWRRRRKHTVSSVRFLAYVVFACAILWLLQKLVLLAMP